MFSTAVGPPDFFLGCSRERSRSLRLQKSVTEHSIIMGAQIRLVSSEAEERAGVDGEAIAVDEAPVGLPEEAEPDKGRSTESRRDEMLGEAAPPLVAEPEDRAGGPSRRQRPKDALARLIAFARPRKAKAGASIMEAGSAEADPESETALGKRGDEDAGADKIVVPAAGATAVANKAELPAESVGPATAAAKPGRPLFARKGAIAVVLMTGVAAAIVVLNWPHGSRPQAVEPGMLADQPTKVMAPSAELATVPPREEPNVAGERPQVHETRRDEVQEVLSFKDLKATASPPVGSPPPTSSPVGASVTEAKPADPTPDPPAAARPTLTVSAPVSPPRSAAPVAGSKAEKVASLPPPASAVVTSVAAAPAPEAEAPGLGEAAKIESRLGELEAAIKEPSNATVTRADIDKAETQTSDQISRLAAIVTRLTGQVKDLEDQVRTGSAGAQEKLADLTRRVSLSESKSAITAAERANGSQVAEASAASASAGVEGQAEGLRIKVAGVDQKRNYRIQAASPGLAMLSAIDGGPDDRPIEVAIGTDLPGYGKVRSIQQHGQAWVVKADRGSIE
jgi:hypothetical protein